MGTKLDVSNSGLKVLMATETKGNAVNKTGKEDCEPAEKIANCPFCKGNHVKVMVNS